MTMTIIRPPQPTIICSLNAAQSALWQRLLAFDFDQEGPYPFSKRLAKEERWPYEYALHVIEEYRKFLFLATVSEQHLLPVDDVRRAWRLHLIYTVSYWKDLCENVLGKRIAHLCENGSEHKIRLQAKSRATMSMYRAYFGEPPEIIEAETNLRGGAFLERLSESLKLKARVKKIKKEMPNLEAKIPPEHQKLWLDLSAFKFDGAFVCYPFVVRLSEENGWTLEFATLVVEEYRKFIYLLRSTGRFVTPSLAVDECWHLHLQNTNSYWQELCTLGNGRPIHHHPGNGSKGDSTRFKAIYQRTLFEYQQVFGTPPESVWGKVALGIDWVKALEETKS